MFEEYDCMKGTGARVVVGQGVVDDPIDVLPIWKLLLTSSQNSGVVSSGSPENQDTTLNPPF